MVLRRTILMNSHYSTCWIAEFWCVPTSV